jgi:hypothetical protein
MMRFNKISGIAETSSEGRYIGGGRDKSAPTEVPVILLKAIIAPLHVYTALPLLVSKRVV